MVAGDLVNTASRLQSRGAARAPSSSARRRSARPARRSPSRRPASRRSRARQAPVPAWRALRVVAERGGRNRSEALEAPFVGRDDELRLLKDLFHATGREGRPRLVSVIGPAGIGKTPRSPGSSSSTSTASSRPSGGTTAAARPTARASASGRSARWSARRAGLLETDDEATTRREGRGDARAARPRPGRARAGSSRRCWPCSAIESGVGSEQLFGAWRTFFERLAATAPGRARLRGLPLRRSGPARLRRPPPRVEPRTSRSTSSRWPGPSCSRSGPTGAPASATSPRSTSSRCPSAAMRELLAGLVPGLPERGRRGDRRPRRRHPAVRGRDGPHARSPRAGSSLEGGAYRPVGDLTNLAVPETLTALIARAPRRARRRPIGRSSRTRPCSARASRSPASRPSRASTEAELEPRLRGARPARAARPSRPTRARPERGQYAFVQALIREVAYNTLAKRDRKTRHLAAARFFESLGTDELAGALAATTWRPTRCAPRAPRRTRWPARPGSRCDGRGRARRRAGWHSQAARFLEQALAVASDASEQADLLEQAGRAASTASRVADAGAFLGRSLDLRVKFGDRNGEARAIGFLGWMLSSSFRVDEASELIGRARSNGSPTSTTKKLWDGSSHMPHPCEFAVTSTSAPCLSSKKPWIPPSTWASWNCSRGRC